mmetsp:Transcript_54769/g.158459  ORF Transcript_54769/g.158459 Transcript_54769/m.158459 type:complete len:271 (-) Transcript_54769:127-939(-)
MLSKISACLAMAVMPVALAELASLRGSAANESSADVPADVPADVAEFDGVDEMWPGSGVDGHGVLGNVTAVAEKEAAGCPHSDQIMKPSDTCAASENYGCAGCYLYRVCRGRTACVINGYMVVPGEPLRGMEDINGGNAGSYDFLFSVARSRCGSNSCVLITNPIHYRTQHQMHIHYRHYNGGGAALKKRLEAALCGTSGWKYFSECGSAKARLYDSMPGVFSAVAAAYGGGSLADVGITVWFTDACGGGQKTMILASTHCSIEHSISDR